MCKTPTAQLTPSFQYTLVAVIQQILAVAVQIQLSQYNRRLRIQHILTTQETSTIQDNPQHSILLHKTLSDNTTEATRTYSYHTSYFHNKTDTSTTDSHKTYCHTEDAYNKTTPTIQQTPTTYIQHTPFTQDTLAIQHTPTMQQTAIILQHV